MLSGLDHDRDLHALRAMRDLIAEHGQDFPHVFAFPSNAGHRTGRDMSGDGRSATPDDTHGYGPFSGTKALALLSRHPIKADLARDFSRFLWRDLPGAKLPDLSPEALEIHRLSSTGHWDVPIRLEGGAQLHLLIYQAGPPVFGGPNDRNLLRNHDETAFWSQFLDGALPMPPPQAPVVVMGGSNLDPHDGDGLHGAMQALLAHPRLQDPRPESAGAQQAGADSARRGPPAQHTVDWPQAGGPGNLRVSYILPSHALRIRDAGVFWPERDSPEADLLGPPDDPPTRHRLVWVDIEKGSLAP